MSRPSTSDDDFARILNWREPVTVARFSRAAAGAILVHVIAFAAFWFSPAPEYRYRRQVSVHFDTRQAVKIVAPRVVKELTQKAPNQGKVTHELDVRAATEGKPAPRSFQPPAPAGPKDRPPAPAPSINTPDIDIDLGAPQIAAVPNGTTILPRPPEPKLTLETVAPAPTGVPANPQLKMPKSTGVEIANAGRAGGGGGGVPSNGDNADPTGLGNMQLLSDPQNIDFKPYMLQVLNLVRRQWFAVIPAIARTGRQGVTVLQFSVDRRGQVPKVVIANTSGTIAFDQAAVASVSASNPFPPLPPEFRGTEIRLQLAFSYNTGRIR